MEFFILNDKFEVQAEIDSYTSLMWCRRAHDVGALDLQVAASEDNVNLFQIGYFIYRKDTNDICRINSIEINTDNEEGDSLIIGATDLKSLAEQVTVIGQYKTQITQDGESKIIIENEVNVEEWIRESLKVFTPYESSTLSKAIYPNFTIDNFALFDLHGHETTCVLNEGENIKLSEHINHLCKMGGFTWEIEYDYENKLLKSKLAKGLSKSINQNENIRILFSRTFDNLQSTKLSQTIDKMANVAVVRHNNASVVGDNGYVYAYFSKDEPYGLYRFDLLVDGTSVIIPHNPVDSDYVEVEAGTGEYKKNDDGTYTKGKGNYNYEPQYSKDEITAYKEILKGLGISKLRENRASQIFESEINFNSFEYRKDFDIGDIVTVQNEYGIELDAKIIEVVETWDETGYSIEPIFEFIDTGNNFGGFSGFGNFENTEDDWYYGDCLITEKGEPLITETDSYYLMYEAVATILETEAGIALTTEEGTAIATYVNRGISTYDAEPVAATSFSLTDNTVGASEIETIKISELPEATNIGDTCCLPIVQNGTTKKIYFSKIKERTLPTFEIDENGHLIAIYEGV